MLALGFGAGLSPVAPGTAGSLAALPLAFVLKHLSCPWYALVLLAAVGLGIWACDRAGRALGVADHRAIVWDEFCGLWLALALVPNRWPWLAAGFLLFRFFDIVKPWPAGEIDRRCKNGAGVMLDDLVAGLWTLIVLAAAGLWL